MASSSEVSRMNTLLTKKLHKLTDIEPMQSYNPLAVTSKEWKKFKSISKKQKKSKGKKKTKRKLRRNKRKTRSRK